MANLNLSEFTEKLFVADADHTFIWDSAALISKRVSRNSWLNSGTLTSDAPVTISQTWNGTGSTVFKALVVNATTPGTTSSGDSLVADFQVGGVSQLRVHKSGGIGLNNLMAIGGISGPWFMVYNGSTPSGYAFGVNTAGRLSLPNTGTLEWASFASGTPNTVLLRDGADNTLALRNGAGVPQAFRVYNTFLGTTANEWFEIDWKTTAGLLKIGTTSGGTGVGRPIELNASGNYINFTIGTVVKFAVVSNRNLSYQSIEFNSDNTHDIGASGANRPRNVYVAGAVLSGGMQLAPGGAIQNTAGTGAYFNITSGASRLRFDLGGGVVWNDSVNNPLGTETVGLMRNATGVLEVNSGTLGAFCDVRCRSVIQQLPITTTITPASNGDLVVEATSNTTLTFKLKGTDGTVRTGTITLA